MRVVKRISLYFSIIAVILPLSYYFYMEEQGNFHTVTKDRVYRSAQLDHDEFASYIGKYHIRSILNLRGKNENRGWYREEIEVSKSLGVKHFDYAISARKDIPPSKIDRIISLLMEAPKPILIHCKAGADRTGLISAAWKLAGEKEKAEKAYEQLSIFYGHFPFLWSETKAMDRSFWKYVNYVTIDHLRPKAGT